MKPLVKKRFQRERRKLRIRGRVMGTVECPRLTVFRSGKQIYAQVVDDMAGRTLCAASSRAKALAGQLKSGGNKDAAKVVGETVARAALQQGIQQVVFDRNGYRFHGRVKALADGARAAGLKF